MAIRTRIWRGPRPRLRREARLGLRCRSDRICRPGKYRPEAVPAGGKRPTTMGPDRAAKDCIVALESRAHTLGRALPEFRRSLDVRKQERHRSRRQLHHNRVPQRAMGFGEYDVCLLAARRRPTGCTAGLTWHRSIIPHGATCSGRRLETTQWLVPLRILFPGIAAQAFEGARVNARGFRSSHSPGGRPPGRCAWQGRDDSGAGC
jgi:hypothetical protein